jgi:hypothetical protein
MNYFLAKTEPSTYSIDDLDGTNSAATSLPTCARRSDQSSRFECVPEVLNSFALTQIREL